jgi:carbon-monoxide dehydrogenase small subunit
MTASPEDPGTVVRPAARPTFTVNGATHDVPDGACTLVGFLRRRGLTGAKLACGAGFCGACSVIADGRPVSSCSVLVAELAGKEVTTIEGLADGDALHPVQESFAAASGFQCGYCTPGMIMMTVALLTEVPDPSDDQIREYLEGNLCRCTGYGSIVTAVRTAARVVGGLRSGGPQR